MPCPLTRIWPNTSHPAPRHWLELCFQLNELFPFLAWSCNYSTARNSCCHILPHQIPTPYNKPLKAQKASPPSLRYCDWKCWSLTYFTHLALDPFFLLTTLSLTRNSAPLTVGQMWNKTTSAKNAHHMEESLRHFFHSMQTITAIDLSAGFFLVKNKPLHFL